MIAFSANTGFLYRELDFVDRIRAAADAGFDAVEFHDEAQATDPEVLRAALDESGLPVLGLNVRMGETNGCAAIPGEEERFRAEFALAYRSAKGVGARSLHVLSGRAAGDEALACYIGNLRHALDETDLTILVEPISTIAMPGYFMNDLWLAMSVIEKIAHPRLKIMFDCFHIAMQHGGCLEPFRAAGEMVGHVQIAGVPDRNEPDEGEIDFSRVIPALFDLGYEGSVGLEYRPTKDIAETLSQLRLWNR